MKLKRRRDGKTKEKIQTQRISMEAFSVVFFQTQLLKFSIPLMSTSRENLLSNVFEDRQEKERKETKRKSCIQKRWCFLCLQYSAREKMKEVFGTRKPYEEIFLTCSMMIELWCSTSLVLAISY